MRGELTQKLYTDFPDLYWQHTLSMSETCMCWGFSCGDGWYDIIYRLSEQITALVANMPEANPKNFCAVQVKEKFGGLRFYMNKYTADINEAIRNAEKEASKTCERCGREGKLLRKSGWLQTVCNECRGGVAPEEEEEEDDDDDENED